MVVLVPVISHEIVGVVVMETAVVVVAMMMNTNLTALRAKSLCGHFIDSLVVMCHHDEMAVGWVGHKYRYVVGFVSIIRWLFVLRAMLLL